MNTKQSIDAFLAEPAVAVVGVSRSGAKFGNLAVRELRAKGYRVYPIHPGATSIGGVPCYSRLEDLPERIGAMLVVVPPSAAEQVVRDAASAGIRHVWLQQGAESPAVLSICRELGIDVVSGECVLMFAHPTGYHNAHRWLRKTFGRLPA
jgi:predicted CoA-binding protein